MNSIWVAQRWKFPHLLITSVASPAMVQELRTPSRTQENLWFLILCSILTAIKYTENHKWMIGLAKIFHHLPHIVSCLMSRWRRLPTSHSHQYSSCHTCTSTYTYLLFFIGNNWLFSLLKKIFICLFEREKKLKIEEIHSKYGKFGKYVPKYAKKVPKDKKIQKHVCL